MRNRWNFKTALSTSPILLCHIILYKFIYLQWHTVDGWNSAPVEAGSLSHYLHVFIHPRWCKISAIHNIMVKISFWVSLKPKHANVERVFKLITYLGRGFQYFYVHPYLGKISNMTNFFQTCWNHQLVTAWKMNSLVRFGLCLGGAMPVFAEFIVSSLLKSHNCTLNDVTISTWTPFFGWFCVLSFLAPKESSNNS